MIRVERASLDDISALMAIERGDGFETLVGRWTAEQHAAEMNLPGSRYLVSRSVEGVDGFVLFQHTDDPHGGLLLRRIAVARPGAGLGTILLDAALAHAFREISAHRVQLRVFPENVRARRVYARAGFVAEGLLREVSRNPDGTYRSMLMMSVLRPDWEARRRDVSGP